MWDVISVIKQNFDEELYFFFILYVLFILLLTTCKGKKKVRNKFNFLFEVLS